VSQAEDNPDPSVIIAALNRVAEEMAGPGAEAAAPTAGIQPAGALDTTADSFTPVPEVFSPPVSDVFSPTSQSVTSDKPTGWDPIRVSTAWPAIRDMLPMAPGSASTTPGATSSSGGTGAGVPWESAPWDADALEAAVAGTGGPAARGAAGAARARGAAPGHAQAARGNAGPGRPASWTRVMVIAAILLCVLAVLLAVFA
jgi:hypothetical protein